MQRSFCHERECFIGNAPTNNLFKTFWEILKEPVAVLLTSSSLRSTSYQALRVLTSHFWRESSNNTTRKSVKCLFLPVCDFQRRKYSLLDELANKCFSVSASNTIPNSDIVTAANKHNSNTVSKWCYYMAPSQKDWELPNSRIWLAEIDIDRGLGCFPLRQRLFTIMPNVV